MSGSAVAEAEAADLELRLPGAGRGAYAVEVRLRLAVGAADTHHEARARLTPEALPDPALDPRAYGAALAAGLFADPRLCSGRPPGPRRRRGEAQGGRWERG